MAKPPNRVLGIDERTDGNFQLRIMVDGKMRHEVRKTRRAVELRRQYWLAKFTANPDVSAEDIDEMPPEQARYWDDQLKSAAALILADPTNKDLQGAAKTIAMLASAASKVQPVDTDTRGPKLSELRSKTKDELAELAVQMSGGKLRLA